MMNNERNFSWTVKVKKDNGTFHVWNESNTARGCKQSWYRTPKSAMKKMQEIVKCEKARNSEIIEAYCFTRSGKRF